jgi:hypothetical protein
MSFYTNIGAVIAAQKCGGYTPPRKPSFWDTWMAGLLVFLVTLAILVALLFAFKPADKPEKKRELPRSGQRMSPDM